MTAVEEIQAAIVKLTALRDERGYVEMNGWLAEPREGATGAIDDPGYGGFTNDPLIVTLHRTVEAQLHILTGTVTLYPSFVANGTEVLWLHAVERAGDLALARAINGGTQ